MAGAQGMPMNGNRFSWFCPGGWQPTETASAVALIAPDQITCACLAIELVPGMARPEQHIQRFLQMGGAVNVQVLQTVPLPSEASDVPGQVFTVVKQVLRFGFQGRWVRGEIVCGTAPLVGKNGYIGTVRGYQCPEEVFDQQAVWLGSVATGIQIRPRGQQQQASSYVAPNNYSPGMNNPMDNSVMANWQQRNSSEGRLSQQWQESMMGVEQVTDSSGQHYDMNLNQYDPTVQGYHNPNNTSEILTPDTEP